MGNDDLTEFRLNELTERVKALEVRPRYDKEMEDFKSYKAKAISVVFIVGVYIFKEPFLRLMAFIGVGNGN